MVAFGRPWAHRRGMAAGMHHGKTRIAEDRAIPWLVSDASLCSYCRGACRQRK